MANVLHQFTVGVGVGPTVTLSLLDSGDLLFTVDGDSIQVRAKDSLNVIATLGTTGSGNNNFNAPTMLANDSGSVYVRDTNNNRIKKHNPITLAYQTEFDVTSYAIPLLGTLAVDKSLLYVGIGSSVYVFNPDTLAEISNFSAGATIKGIAVGGGYIFVAKATSVDKYDSNGALVATWATTTPVGAGYATAGLATDGTYVYVLFTKAATAGRIYKLYAADLFESTYGDMTGKQGIYAICADATYVFFTDTTGGAKTVNRVDNDLDVASLAAVTDITTPRGISCLPGGWTSEPDNPVSSISATLTATPAGTATIAGEVSLAGAVTVTPTATAAFAVSATLAAALTVTPSGSAAFLTSVALSAAVTVTPTGTAAMGVGSANTWIKAVDASSGTAGWVDATVNW